MVESYKPITEFDVQSNGDSACYDKIVSSTSNATTEARYDHLQIAMHDSNNGLAAVTHDAFEYLIPVDRSTNDCGCVIPKVRATNNFGNLMPATDSSITISDSDF